MTFGKDVPADLLTSIKLVDTAALDTQLTTLAGNPVVFALEAVTGDLVGKDGSTEVIRIHITGASLTNAATGEVTYTYSTTLSQPIEHASLDGQPGDNSENSALLSGVTFAVTDNDTDTTQGTFNVTIVDDVPVQTAGTEAQTVYEDLLAGGNPDTPANPVGASTVATGTLAALVSFGADQPGTFSLSTNTAGLPALTSNGQAVVYNVNGNLLTAYVDTGATPGVLDAGDRQVFTLQITDPATGAYTFTLLDQLDHQGGNLSGAGDDQIKTIDFSSMLVATDADLDQVALDAGSLLITVEDDLPINNATSVTGAVDEDSLNNVSGAFGSLGNLDAVNVGRVAGGSLAGLVTVGADEPATTFGFTGSFAGLTAQALTSQGVALSYSVSGLMLIGFVDLGVAGGAFEVGTDRPVFTLTLSLSGTNNATYTFTLLDQLDHLGGNLSGAGDDQIKTIDFSSMLVATDADLDQVALDAGSLLITVEDDLPINNATSVTGAVDEDSLNNVSGAFGSLGNLDAVNVGTVAGGSLAGLVTVGADEPATFGFTGSFAGLTAQALTSQGAALSYSVSGLTLTGFVDLGVAGGAFQAGVDRPVFTLTLSGTNNATYTFTLLDQLDHQGGNLSGAGDDQIKTIDFSSMLVATDADLDQVALDAGSLLITVEDDLPINNATSVTGAVDEDSLNNVSGAFGSLGNLDAVNVGTVAGGSLAGLVTVGADEPATFGFAGSFAGLTAQALTSQGAALSYSVSGLTLTGFVDLGVAGGASEAGVDRPVFTLTLSGTNNATYTFTLLDQLDHQGGNLSGAGDDQIKTIDFSSMLVATDADLDQVALDAGSLLITVEDDLPINNATSVTGAVDEDSLPTGNLDAVNVGTVAGGSLAGLVTVGADEPATFGFAGSFAGLTAQALTSQGAALSYSVSGLTLTGFVDLGVAGGAYRSRRRPAGVYADAVGHQQRDLHLHAARSA